MFFLFELLAAKAFFLSVATHCKFVKLSLIHVKIFDSFLAILKLVVKFLYQHNAEHCPSSNCSNFFSDYL